MVSESPFTAFHGLYKASIESSKVSEMLKPNQMHVCIVHVLLVMNDIGCCAKLSAFNIYKH